MQRLVFIIAFTLTFIGLLALGGGFATPAQGEASSPASGSDSAPTIRIAQEPTTLPANPSETSFGRLMPDGTYCGVGCPDEP